MKVSYQRLSRWFTPGALPNPQKLAEILTLRGLEVEEIHDEALPLKGVVIAKILEKGQHPNSDRLSLCKVDDGTQIRMVVCGAQNHKTGDTVVLATEGTHLPNGLTIKKTTIRGVDSVGMLCSESELGLAKESEGILILPSETTIGQSFTQYAGLEDVIFTLKLYANQGYALSYRGIAREVASALSIPLKTFDEVFSIALGHSFSAKNVLVELKKRQGNPVFGGPVKFLSSVDSGCPLFYSSFIDQVKAVDTPEWMKRDLERQGARSLHVIVDLTNWLMQELGQPTHAYDSERISSGLGVALAKTGQKVKLLDDTNVEMSGDELVIVNGDANEILGLAGVMGGDASKVIESTHCVALEAAWFAPEAVRKTKRIHKKSSDAATRFERGVDPKSAQLAICALTFGIEKITGGKIQSFFEYHDIKQALFKNTAEDSSYRATIQLDLAWLARFLGLSLESNVVEKLLVSLGCNIESRTDTGLVVLIPSYRFDLNLREDLAEEIARTYGFDKIPETIPPLLSQPNTGIRDHDGQEFFVQTKFKELSASAGFSEAIHFGFHDPRFLQRFGFTDGVRLLNPLSEEFAWMVPSLIPGLVDSARKSLQSNFEDEFPSIRLMELRPVFSLKSGHTGVAATAQDETSVAEVNKAAFLWAGSLGESGLKSHLSQGIDFYAFKGSLEGVFAKVGVRGLRVLAPMQAVPSFFHPYQVAEVKIGQKTIGFLGALHPEILEELKLRVPVFVGEFDWSSIRESAQLGVPPKSYKYFSVEPGMTRDYTFLVPDALMNDKIQSTISSAGKPLASSVRLWDVYRGPGVAEGLSALTYRVYYQQKDRSLTEEEVEVQSRKVLEAVKSKLNLEIKI